MDVLTELERQHDRLPMRFETRPNQVRVRQADQSLFPGDIPKVNPEKGYDLKKAALVNQAQAGKLIDTWRKLPVLYVGEPAMGDVIVLVVLLPGNLLAQFLNSSR